MAGNSAGVVVFVACVVTLAAVAMSEFWVAGIASVIAVVAYLWGAGDGEA